MNIPLSPEHIYIPDEMPKAPRANATGQSHSWAVYNAMRDLPIGNRTPLSKLKRDVARISRHAPMVISATQLLGSKPRRFVDFLAGAMALGDVEPVCVGIDASLTSTGTVILFEVAGQLVAWSKRAGYGLTTKSTTSEIEHRKVRIVRSILGPLRSISKRSGEPHIRSFIEDYAFGVARSGTTSRIIQLAELQGAIKIQVLALTGVPVEPVPISTARGNVLCKGSAKKDEILEAMVRGGLGFVQDEAWTDDEIDALVIAMTHYMSTHEPDYQALAWEELTRSTDS